MKRRARTLVFDADDTLWENNILFERVIEDFIAWLAHPTMGPEQVRAVLDDIESANAAVDGYGTAMLLRSLRDCFERLRERALTPAERQQVETLAAALIEREVELIADVPETLAALSGRYELLLFTKGHPDEQKHKVEASGLAGYFSHISIVEEKRLPDYRRLVEEHRLDPDLTWMVGNSVRSDVIPARQVGMGAVFVPNAHTWVLEHAELDPHDDRIVTIGVFRELLDHF